VREVTTKGVGWAFGKASDLVAPPLNLVLYMHLRIFAYTSNTLIASFEYMELILASGTLKNFRFLLRSCLSTDRAPVITDLFYPPVLSLYHSAYGAPEGCVLILGCALGPDEVLVADVGHPFVFQNTGDPGRIVPLFFSFVLLHYIIMVSRDARLPLPCLPCWSYLSTLTSSPNLNLLSWLIKKTPD
jgi:hypothetical protein